MATLLFFLVAASKNVGLAKQMFEKNGELPNIHGANQLLPIQVAVQQGHKVMVEFLKRIHGSLEEMDSNESSGLAQNYLYTKPELANSREESNGETTLHILARSPKFANQKQQEIFKRCYKAKNANGKTPRDIFFEKTTALEDGGEKWMKDTATSCMVVATLIASVVFTAAFKMPGTKEETGTPNFIQKLSFRTFVISDAISLTSSSRSILTFLSIITARYADEDFHYVLPRKLVVGFSTLFLSIASMMVAFCASIFIVFKDGAIWIPIFVGMIASLSVISLTKQHWGLLYGVVRSSPFLPQAMQKNTLLLQY